MARKTAAKADDNETTEEATTTPASEAQLVVGNATKKHFLTFPLENGLVGVVAVDALTKDHVDANYTAVGE